MANRTLVARLQRAEEVAKPQSKFAVDCICFPEKEQPFFPYYHQQEAIAAKVNCPLHGNRFKQPIFHIYVSRWQRDREPRRRQRSSAQYRKAWHARFPPELTEPSNVPRGDTKTMVIAPTIRH